MRAQQFISACRRLQDLDLSAGQRATLHESVAVTMPRQYAMPFPSELRVSFDRHDTLPTRNRRGQYHELVQHLTDLGYLERRVFIAWHRRRARNEPPTERQLTHLFAAVVTFWREDDCTLWSRVAPPPDAFAARREWVERHLPVLVYRLAGFTSFDGDLEVPTDYRVGECSCYGRSLAFRVRVLFFLDRDKIGGQYLFTRAMFPHLFSLNASLGGALTGVLPTRNARSLHPRVWELLSDWSALFTAFQRANKVVADTDGGGRRPYYLVYDTGEKTPDGERRLPVGDREERRQRRLEKRVRRKLGRAELHADTGPNHLGMRLVQIALWRAGFYTGAIDGAFGPQSHRALHQLIEQERGAERPVIGKRRLRRLLVNADGSVWVADLKLLGRVLLAYAPTDEATAEREEEEIWQTIAANTEGEDWELNLLDRQQELGHEQYPDLVRHPRRRVYYGLRGLIRGAWRALKSVVTWVVRKVGEVAGAVFDFLKAVVKRIQEGIGLFFEGFRYFGHYVLGRPFVTRGAAVSGVSPVLATKLSVDFDINSVINATASDADLAAHRDYLRSMRRGMEFFLEAVTKIIRFIGSLTTPLGWVRVGVFIARLVRDLLRGRPPAPVFA